MSDGEMDERLGSHLIDAGLLRADDFTGFMTARQASLVELIEGAIGKAVVVERADPEPEMIDEDPTELDLLGPEAI